MNILDILHLLDRILELEQKVEELIASEKDKKKRKKISEAFQKRDREALSDLLFD